MKINGKNCKLLDILFDKQADIIRKSGFTISV